MEKDLFGYNISELKDVDKGGDKYSKKVDTPIYTPRGRDTSIYACYDDQRYRRLLRMIDQSNVTIQEKTFLMRAASRFIEFNYENIADYYAASSKEMQLLMEKLALVIIDFDKAIENGFVQLNERMKILYEHELEESGHE